ARCARRGRRRFAIWTIALRKSASRVASMRARTMRHIGWMVRRFSEWTCWGRGRGSCRFRAAVQLRQNKELHFTRTMDADDQRHFDIGGFGGAGDERDAAGVAVF